MKFGEVLIFMTTYLDSGERKIDALHDPTHKSWPYRPSLYEEVADYVNSCTHVEQVDTGKVLKIVEEYLIRNGR